MGIHNKIWPCQDLLFSSWLLVLSVLNGTAMIDPTPEATREAPGVLTEATITTMVDSTLATKEAQDTDLITMITTMVDSTLVIKETSDTDLITITTTMVDSTLAIKGTSDTDLITITTEMVEMVSMIVTGILEDPQSLP